MSATKRTTKRFLSATLPLAVLLAVGCQRTPELDTRTFALEHIRPHEAQQLIEPYVYGDRPEAPGAISGTMNAVTVRETRDNLDKIERVLAEHHVPRADVRLHFQLIEADGYSGADSAIAEVEAELRKLFDFQGYRLLGEAFVTATDGGEIAQALTRTGGSVFQLRGAVYWAGPQTVRLDEIAIFDREGAGITTTVNIRPGQTLVLGSTPRSDASSTLLLTVLAEEVEG